MEPLTILGLVSNIVQLVDAGAKAAKVCQQIYKHGASIEDLRLADTSEQLHRCYSTLNSSLQSNQTPLTSQGAVDLKQLSEQCCESARSLHEELEALQKTQGGGYREALSKLIRRKRKASEIERHKARLDEYQKTLDTKVLVDIRQTLNGLSSEQCNRDIMLESKLGTLSASLASCNVSAATVLKAEIERAIEANKHEHEVTRNLMNLQIGDTMQTLKTAQAQQRESRKQQEMFLESLRFDDINSRLNDVSDSNTKTLGWIFDDEISRPWDSFSDWLKHGQKVYWINGKAGSGKSTLMKFITKDERTNQALKTWSNERPFIILTFYFWLSGSKLQRNTKGFLCSLMHQICLKNDRILESVYQNRDTIAEKRANSDWSLSELRDSLYFAIRLASHDGNVYIFLDGIDEFDQGEDVQDLLDFIKCLSEFQNVKFCISSRPEAYLEEHLSQHSKLRLQDLTKQDIEICIQDKLDEFFSRDPKNVTQKKRFDEFTELMTKKADGVFLWVHFALQSLLKGMRNEDDFQILFERLEELPSGMERLYEQMWKRLNGDERRYRAEASLYFSYHEFFPLPLFELMVAVHDDVLNEYLQDLRPQNIQEVAQRYEGLKKKILTRCAGLIEVANDDDDEESDDDDYDDDDDQEEEGEGEGRDHQSAEEDLSNLSDNENYEDDNDHSHQHVRHRLIPTELYRTKVRFLHRTARDFILNTATGHTIAGEPSLSYDQRFVNITKAQMASLLQGFGRFEDWSIRNIFHFVGNSETEYEIELLTEL